MRPVVGQAPRERTAGRWDPSGSIRRRWCSTPAIVLSAMVGVTLLGVGLAGGPGRVPASAPAVPAAASSAAWSGASSGASSQEPGGSERTPSGLIVHSTLGTAVPDDPEETAAKAAAAGDVLAPSGLRAPVVGASAVRSRPGWWEVAADGSVFALGGAPFLGSAGSLPLSHPVVGMASTPDGRGYWLVAADGGIFTFGDARFLGSTGALALRQPIVGMASTPDGRGYWLVAADGGIFTFGDARFLGSTGALALRQPIVGMASTPDGRGYWLVAADGGIFTFGDARFQGAAGNTPSAGPARAVAPTTSGKGYWIVAGNGAVLAFGDAPAVGSAVAQLSAAVVGVGIQPGPGLRLVAADGSSIGLSAAGPAAAAVPSPSPSQPAGNPQSYTYLVTNADGTPVRYNACAPIHYVMNLSEAPPGAEGLVAGVLAWISVASGLTFDDDGTTTEVPSTERAAYQPNRYGDRWAPVLVAWSRPSETDLLPGGNVIGEGGSSWVQPSGGEKSYVSGEAVIDADDTANLAVSFGAGATLGQLLMHELGHVVGLGHTHDATQIMYPTLLALPAATYGAGDLTGLANLGIQAGCIATPGP